jgi:MOSC domain-containing protein YiiM
VDARLSFDETHAHLLRLFLSPGHNFVGHHGRSPGRHPVVEVTELRCVAGRGLEGDRYFDYEPDYKGQVTFFAAEVYDALCERLGVHDRPPAVLRRNILTRGLDLNALIGVEFGLQGVRFLGTEESRPCDWMNLAFGPGARAALKGHGGLRAKVLSHGTLRCGPAKFIRMAASGA